MSRKNRDNRANANAIVEDQELDTVEATEEELDAVETEAVEPMPVDKVEELIEEADKVDAEDKTSETEELPELDNTPGEIGSIEDIDAALNNAAIVNENTVDVKESAVDPIADEEEVEEKEYSSFSKEALIEILDSEVNIDSSKATIYNTVDDMIAAAKLNSIYKVASKAGGNNAIAKVISQALKFASTPADKRKGDVLFSTLMREINISVSGKDFDLLMFVVTRTFKALRTFSEPAIVRSFREVKNVEVKQSALLLSHLISQLATPEDRKNKIGVTISLDRAVQLSPNGLNQNGVNLVKEYFKK